MKTNDIRRTFLDFFAARGHRIVPSASLVPANDPTLLFTSAGMVPFKNAFLGRERPSAPRIADVQRCLRAGGKHNDLEQVGYTARHHTFFEMLGNWSFGDYFKREAIAWAWELLTEGWKLPPERLWVTVYHTDDEAYDIWAHEIGVPDDRIARIGDNQGAPYASDNFWQMADTGPCGPCTEVFYDHGPALAGAPPGSDAPEGDRFVEIWNLVFMQYDRASDGTMTPLPAPCVDTGMGLERIAAVLQGVHSNYDIDLFQHLIRAAAEAIGAKDLQSNSLKVIADHIRATAFLIADGVMPSNERRGYVLRRIMRRAIRHGYQLGQNQPFFHRLVAPLAEEMGDAYPEIVNQANHIEEAIFLEEERFAKTLKFGMFVFEGMSSAKLRALHRVAAGVKLRDPIPSSGESWLQAVSDDGQKIFRVRSYFANEDVWSSLDDHFSEFLGTIRDELAQIEKDGNEARFATLQYVYAAVAPQIDVDGVETRLSKLKWEFKDVSDDFKSHIKVIALDDSELPLSGQVVFVLYDTYGFPVDLTADIARERGFKVDMAGFEREMEAQRELARAASHFETDYSRRVAVEQTTEFSGYERTEDEARVAALFRDAELVERLRIGEEGMVVLDRTPFYAESGGQVGDSGAVATRNARFIVTDTQKRGNAYVHVGRVEKGTIDMGDTVNAEVDTERRQAIVLNHSATHLLHAALRKLLGTHVTQKGSLVAPDRLRFDFSHPRPVTAEELVEIEDVVNAEIRANAAADVREMSYDEAIGAGAMALFGEKYGDTVRVMRFGDFSTELCGGTHVARTGDIGLFKIVAESGIAAGVRRIEAVTGAGALAFVREEEHRLGEIAALVKAGREDVAARVRQLAERTRMQEKELADLRRRLAGGQGGDLAAQAVEIAGHKLLAARLDGADAQTLRAAVDRLKDKLGSAAIVLGAVEGGKVRLAAGVTPDLVKRLPASELVNAVAERVGGRGGGRSDFAQAGGTEPDKLDDALAHVTGWAGERLAGG